MHKDEASPRVYVNEASRGATFHYFTGSEKVLRDMDVDTENFKPGDVLGWHDYAGMALVVDRT